MAVPKRLNSLGTSEIPDFWHLGTTESFGTNWQIHPDLLMNQDCIRNPKGKHHASNNFFCALSEPVPTNPNPQALCPKETKGR